MILADYILASNVKDDILFRAVFEGATGEECAQILERVCERLPSIKPLLARETDELSGGEIALTLIAGILVDGRKSSITEEFTAPLSTRAKKEVEYAISRA
ncbi:MAG: hypothetical protein LBL41_02740 [Bifidobacteriaceae bacterium]|jgi:energy-coupling factor transporter ATP-binding protein EcfA2|nr:hypothetical protein [Bifidobacteriaceae bacterium]